MALKIDEHGATLADVIAERVGRRPGMRLVAFLQAWDLLRDELGRPPTVDEYAKRFTLTPASAYRDRKLFDDAFPQQTPDEILDLLWQWHDARGGALLGARVSDHERDEARALVDEYAGKWTGLYPPGYLDELRDEWER
jgi:hypothetical protein